MAASGLSWGIVPYLGDSAYKRARVYDEAQTQAVLRHLLAHECVALLGPPLSEKSDLLRDVAEALRETRRYRPLYVDLWQTRSHDEAAFFTSLAWQIGQALGREATVSGEVPDARAFQNYLSACVAAGEAHLALMVDHLQALPHDLVHSLLVALRSAYMEWDADAPRQFVAVVTGGMNLVGLSTGPTSPFNIAKPVVVLPLIAEQSLALAQATLIAHGCVPSPAALARIVEWCGGDRYLLPRLCAWSADVVRPYRRPLLTRAAVDRAAARMCARHNDLPPIRAAIRLIEEDPDTMLDVLHLLDHGALPRARSRQMPTRTGTDRLQLSGAVLLTDGRYSLLNLAYRQALAGHFTTERVAHILRIAGRWSEAIEYLAPRLADAPEDHDPRPQLLEATVQSIYAADSLVRAAGLLADGLRLGFGLTDVGIYRAVPAQGRLERVYPPTDPAGPSAAVDLHDPACVEAQTFHHSTYALRGSAEEARLVVTLSAGARPIGVVTVERYVTHRDPHELPGELPDVLHFLQHAASALENVMYRAAYRTIGQAVLDARAMQPTVTRVLEATSEALGCDYAELYLVDDGRRTAGVTAAVGRPWGDDGGGDARLPLTGSHPAVSSLREGRMRIVRGADERMDRAYGERFEQRRYTRVFLPLRAASEDLGTLELGYAAGARVRLGEESKRTFAAFADQVAIAVHNMQLLRRTDEALARKMAELAVGQEIQLSLLPKTCPEAPGWEFAASYSAARIVGGDFYDFCELADNPPRLGLVIADVAGKGVPAALFMALSRTIIRTTAFSGRSPASALMRANQLILKDSQAEMFLTAVYAVLELDTGRLIYANAGHNRPLWRHAADGRVTELDQRGIVLGAFEEIRLEEQRLDLAPGDALILYTDGVTEALNGDGEEFGEDRLAAVIAASRDASADETIGAICGALAAFTGGAEPADDVTVVVVRRI
jgi:sigma-B regulation protein RsbU (phosphoserine phosphatase)